MLNINNVSITYPVDHHIRFPNIELNKSAQCLILGKSGSGKTTLLHIIAGLRQPKSGSVQLAGQEILDMPVKKSDRFRGKHIGLVFQQPHLINALSVRENLELAGFFNGIKNKSRAAELLGELGIVDKIDARTYHLSHGEKQRVTIARALMNYPDLILADEPTANLDDANTNIVGELLKSQASKNDATLIIATHDQRLKSIFDHQLTLS